MVINTPYISLLLLVIGAGFSCSKKESTCPRLGYEFGFSKPGITYSPSVDSIALGDLIILEASAPKTFFDEEKGYTVTLNQNTILGPLVIKKATSDPLIPIIGAANDVSFLPFLGNVIKDTTQFSEGQLKIFRTAYFVSEADSFKIRLGIKPTIKGVFFVSLNQQGNRDSDCAVYKYFLKIKNTDQHLHYLAQFNNGIIDEAGRDYLYCFKVY